MRPPEFTGGNASRCGATGGLSACFNEAAGIHRRKPWGDGGRGPHRVGASMRPPEFTGGNRPARLADRSDLPGASMRPPEFTGGNAHAEPVDADVGRGLQ